MDIVHELVVRVRIVELVKYIKFKVIIAFF